MPAPRRVPWSSQAELAGLYEMIYSPTADYASHKRAISRMSIYLASPSCPTFIHLAHSLLSADLLSRPHTQSQSQSQSHSQLWSATDPVGKQKSAALSVEEVQAARLGCAMAVVRFVNGLVDPLQTGPYARPISHLAASLHIPPSLVALRHRATHEDIPPLPLLQKAVHSCIDYLHHYSFLPVLASSSSGFAGMQSSQALKRGRAAELIGRWKRVAKARLREGTGAAESKEEKRVKKDIEGEDVRDVVDAMLFVGGLIPLATKKRPSLEVDRPTRASQQIWTPLMIHMSMVQPSFPSLLAEQIAASVLARASSGRGNEDEAESEELSKWSLAVWLITLWRGIQGGELSEQVKGDLRRRIMVSLPAGDHLTRRLYESLVECDSVLAAATAGIDQLLDDGEELSGLELDAGRIRDSGTEADLLMMEQRLNALERRDIQATAAPVNALVATCGSTPSVPGWQKLDAANWRACPIGHWGSIKEISSFA